MSELELVLNLLKEDRISKESRSEILRLVREASERYLHQEQMMRLAQQQMNDWWEMISQRERLIQSILDSADDLIITFSESGHILNLNGACEAFATKPLAHARGAKIDEFLTGGSVVREILSLLHENKEPEYSTRRKGTLIRRPGDEAIVNFMISKIIASKSVVYVLMVHDMTEELRTQSELESTRAQAISSSKMAALGEMAGGIAHEINSPLNIFTMSAGLLRDAVSEKPIDTELILRTSQRIEETALRIAKIIQGLRSFSRDDSRDSLEYIILARSVEDALSLCQEKLKGRNVVLSYDPILETCVVKARSVSLTQVLINLIGNSSDAIESLDEKWIRIGYEETDLFHILTVTDSGLGLSPDLRDKVMQPFFTTKPIGKGTGLGLSLSRGIVEGFGGKLVYNDKCSNTQFQVFLPKERIAA